MVPAGCCPFTSRRSKSAGAEAFFFPNIICSVFRLPAKRAVLYRWVDAEMRLAAVQRHRVFFFVPPAFNLNRRGRLLEGPRRSERLLSEPIWHVPCELR